MSPVLPPKKEVALALLERASVFIHLDPRGEGVMVPAWLKQQPQLVLQVGLNMAVQIPDLQVSEEAVSCTLSFSRRPQYCSVPWRAVYALVGEDGRGMIWPEDIPSEVAAQTNQQPALRRVDDAGAPKVRVRRRKPKSGSLPAEAPAIKRADSQPKLVALPGAKVGRSDLSRDRSSDGPPPHLRLVK